MRKPAVPILTTGKSAYPVQRPIAAVWEDPRGGKGRMAVLGAGHVFEDAYLDLEALLPSRCPTAPRAALRSAPAVAQCCCVTCAAGVLLLILPA